MSSAISPELALLAACCRWPPSPSREAAVREAAAPAIDWSRFERVVTRHRVAALARDGLRRAAVPLPAEVEQRLAKHAATAARTALSMAQETLRLQKEFDDAGLPVVFVKGSSLAVLAYGDLGIKESWDIDLLTTPEKAVEGRRLLEQLGYRMFLPSDLDDKSFLQLVAFGKECALHNPALNLSVELHWRLVSNERVMPALNVWPATQMAPLASGGIRTLDDDMLFAYLCVHGTAHGWFRLKWLADVAAFLGARDDVGIDRLYLSSVELGAGRAPAVALLLCHRLLGLSLSDALLSELRSDRLTSFVEAVAVRCIAYGHGEREFPQYSLTDLGVTLSHFLAVPGAKHFWSEVRLKWTSTDDRMHVALPRPLHFLYHFIRLPRWAWRFATKRLGRLTA